jgi:ABC-type bacteriocin/lantibiotic exporter with double-glycine peptidase domain
VPQNISIFDASLYENVAIGSELSDEPSRSRVASLLVSVGLGELLNELEKGIDTNLGEMGSVLSGGQIQKIGIARALFSNPQILIFDESTSSLDSISESEIMDLLLSLRTEKTLIFVAHRLSTIKTVDRILYVNAGVIEAEGNFTELRSKVANFDTQVKLLDLS